MEAIQLALYHFEQNNSDEAIKIIKEILSSAGDEEKYQAAYLLFDFGFMKEAKDIIENLLRDNKTNSSYKSLLADIHIELNEDEKAIQLLHDINPRDESYLPSLIQLADLYQSQGLFEVAEQKLHEAKSINPEEEIIDLALAELYFSLGNFSKCIPIYEHFITEHSSIGGIILASRLGEAYAALGNHEKAFTYYEQIQDETPDILFKFGLSAFHLERYQVAIQKWTESIELDPYYYIVYRYLGEAYYLENMLDEANEVVQLGLTYDEHNDELFYLAAKIAQRRKQTDKAINFIQQAIKMNPERREFTLFYISLLRESFREEEVVGYLLEALNNDYFDPVFEWELAKSYYEIDEFEKALKYYGEASKYFEEDAKFLYEYGYILIEAGKIVKGKEILNKYVRLEPADYDTIELLNRL